MAAAEASLALRMVGAQRTLAFIEQTLLTLLGSAKPANLRILEGLFAKLLAAKFDDAHVLAIDPSADAIAGAKEEAPAVPANLTLQISDFHEFEAADASYDLVIFTRSLHHIYSMPKAVDKAHRLLKSNGIIALQEFARERIDADTAQWLWDRLELLEATGAGAEALNKAATEPTHAHAHAHAHEKEHGHGHEGHAHKEEKEKKHGHSHDNAHGHSHAHKEEKREHGHAHDSKEHSHSHDLRTAPKKENCGQGHGAAHGHSHEGAPDLSEWRAMAKKDPVKLWQDFHWHSVPLSTGAELVGEMTRVFGGVHYQEPRTPYLYFYAEHGLKANISRAAEEHRAIVPGLHLNVLNAVLEQELLRIGERPAGSVGLNIAAQKK